MLTKHLVEVMQRHRDKLCKSLSLQLCQPDLGELVLHEETVEPSVLRQAAVAQDRADQDLLLPTCQYVWSGTNFPRRYPLHDPNHKDWV